MHHGPIDTVRLVLSIALCGALLTLSACSEDAKPLDTSVEYVGGETVFAFTMDDFINGWNSAAAHGDEGDMRPSAQWRSFDCERSPNSAHAGDYHRYSADESIHTMPTVTVFTPTGDGRVQLITVDFDDHGFSEQLYSLYEDMCFRAVKTVLPALVDEQIERLCAELNDLAYENVTETPHEYGARPCAMYRSGGVGLYPYFAYGDFAHLCIVPVDDDYIAALTASGTVVIEITAG